MASKYFSFETTLNGASALEIGSVAIRNFPNAELCPIMESQDRFILHDFQQRPWLIQKSPWGVTLTSPRLSFTKREIAILRALIGMLAQSGARIRKDSRIEVSGIGIEEREKEWLKEQIRAGI